MKKRIIISVTNDLVSDQRVHKVATTLYENGYDILLIGRRFKKSISLQRIYKTKRIRLLNNKGVFFYAEYNIKLFFILLFLKCDILLANDLDTLLANFLVSKIRNKKTVYDSHEYFTEVPELVNRLRIKRIWQGIEKRILPKLKNTYTVCESIANIYNQEYKTNFQVIRNLPLSTKKSDTIKSPFPKGKKIILYQGALNLGRGIENMIQAMEYLSDYHFVIIGDGDIAHELKALVYNKKLSHKIQFVGKLPFEELYNYTPFAHIGVSLEENLGLNYYYALPNKLFDYIQAGIPVLVSDFPEMKKIVETYKIGKTISTKEPQEIAEVIKEMMLDTNIYNSYKDNVKIASDELIWENEENKLIKLFKEIN